MSLSGYTAAEFGEAEQDAFRCWYRGSSVMFLPMRSQSPVLRMFPAAAESPASTSSIVVDFKIEVTSMASVSAISATLTATEPAAMATILVCRSRLAHGSRASN